MMLLASVLSIVFEGDGEDQAAKDETYEDVCPCGGVAAFHAGPHAQQ